MDFINYYVICAVIISSIFAKKETNKNRGYDVERSLRIRLVECMSGIVMFLSITFIFIGLVYGKMKIAYSLIVIEILLLNLDQVSLLIKSRIKLKTYLFYPDNKDKKSEQIRKYRSIYYYNIQYLITFITIFVPVFLIAGDVIFYILKLKYNGFPLSLHVMEKNYWTKIIIALSILNILILNKQYKYLILDVKNKKTVELNETDRQKLNEWYATIEQDDKKM